MLRDSGTGSFAKVQSHVQAARFVDLAQSEFDALGQFNQLMRGGGGKPGERIKVLIRHDQDVPGGIGVGVQADIAVFAAMDDVRGLFGLLTRHPLRDRVVDRGDHIAEDAVFVLRLGSRGRPRAERRRNPGAGLWVGAGDVAVAPGSPEAIHWASIRLCPEFVRPAIRQTIIARNQRRTAAFRTDFSQAAGRRHDMVMKMLGPDPRFVDGLPAKFYA